jgi:Right handed beta helix region
VAEIRDGDGRWTGAALEGSEPDGAGSNRAVSRFGHRLLAVLTAWAYLFSLVSAARAVDYYVSASAGSDANSGQSASKAWQTLERVNRAPFLPGDSVLLRRGDVWHEVLRPAASGAPGNPITFSAYGDGLRPVISGRLETFEPGQERSSFGRRKGGAVPLDEPDAIRSFRDVNIDNHEQSHIIYDGLDLREAREGLRLYAWRGEVTDITLKNCVISSEKSQPHGIMSAGVYASVASGRLSQIAIQNNTFIPYPRGLEHWGIYFVHGVSGFRIENNTFEAAGEDAITIWHSDAGVIANNGGGRNGENTIDVKDSHDIEIENNRAENDGEYNIVVHGVDSGSSTFNVVVERNRCRRAGEAGQLTSGIAVLFAQRIRVTDNFVEEALGAGIFENDRGSASGNEIAHNWLRHNGTQEDVGAITLELPSSVKVSKNTVDGQRSSGFGIRIEGTSRAVILRNNQLMTGSGNMVELTAPNRDRSTADEVRSAHSQLAADGNSFYSAKGARFRIASNVHSLEEWRRVTGQDVHSQEFPQDSFVVKASSVPETP